MARDSTSQGHIHELLASSPILSVLAPEDRQRLSGQCVERTFAKNQVVYLAGEPGDSIFVLTSGEPKVCHFSADGGKLIVASIMPGEPIGELGMLSHLPRSATVIAAKPSAAMMLPRAVVMELIEERPSVAVALLQHLAELTRKMNGLVADLVFLDMHQRVARFLVSNTQGASRSVRITRPVWPRPSERVVNASTSDSGSSSAREWSLSSGTIRVIDRDALRLAVRD